nr:uncharacterized protein CTRU02_15864 [Colletotrichum truncatum]XP_036576213.1 uncharacterized protein CTRU02_13900 [Colletotrichum truncatum]KAF6780581.1 hypothetical protein CTRU02_15864 [Colletotrichum truncatum]KAF6782902.1 hypothetical protein CTRU02_13900 [Colletotrichum truncatum]
MEQAIKPFVYKPEYPVVICTTCKFAVVSNEVATHLKTRHSIISITDRAKIIHAVSSLPDIIKSQAELKSLRYPQPTDEPVPYITPPRHDGLRCQPCGYVCCSLFGMQKHCRDTHGWENDWKKG